MWLINKVVDKDNNSRYSCFSRNGSVAGYKRFMPFVKAYYHLIWTTHDRQPTIDPDWEQVLFSAIDKKCDETKTRVLAVNTVSDHIHLAVDLNPTVALSQFIGQVKGFSSYVINNSIKPASRFAWQESFGALSFSETALAFVLAYVENQKQHHADGSIFNYLESTD